MGIALIDLNIVSDSGTPISALQSAITLTTTGSSGASTFASNVLNIPNYTLAGLGGQPQLNGTGFVKASGTTISYDNSSYYLASNPSGFISGITSLMVTTALGYTPVPPSRTLTINGTTFDLSADRSWTVGAGISGSGTNNYVAKWTGTSSIGNSNIQDSSTLVSINSETYVNGLLSANKLILYGGPEMIRMYASTPYISFWNAANTTRFGFIQAYAGLMEIITDTGNALDFNVSGASRIRITTAGNVGIGTSSPLSQLHVGAGSQTPINLANTRLIVANSGNSGRSALLTISNDGSGNQIEGQFESSGESAEARIIFGSATNHPLTFRTNNTERMRITSDGKVGIGTTSPYSYVRMHVANGFRANADTATSNGFIEVYRSGGSNNISLDANFITLNIPSRSITMNAFGIVLSGIPTSSAGLSSGYLWQDGSGYLRIVP